MVSVRYVSSDLISDGTGYGGIPENIYSTLTQRYTNVLCLLGCIPEQISQYATQHVMDFELFNNVIKNKFIVLYFHIVPLQCNKYI